MHLVTQSWSQIISNFWIWCGNLSILLPYTAQQLLDIGITMFFFLQQSCVCVSWACEHLTSYELWPSEDCITWFKVKELPSVTSSMFCLSLVQQIHLILLKSKAHKKQMMKVAMQETKKHYWWMLTNIQVKTVRWLRSLEKMVPVSQRSPLKPPSPPFYTLHLHKHLPRCVPSDSSETLRSLM